MSATINHIVNTQKSYKKIIPVAFFIKLKLLIFAGTDYKSARSGYFNNDSSQKFKSLRTSVDNLVECIFDNSDDERSHKLIDTAYILYKAFSKLEHFGELSFPLVHIVYHDSKQHILVNELFSSIRIILAALNNYCHVWEDLEINFNKLKDLEIEILKMVPQENSN